MAQLLRAAGNGNLDKVIELRDQWNSQNKKGETALHVAVAEDQLEVVKHLVSHGAMLNLQEKKNKFTPLMLCLAQQPPHFEEIFAAILKGKPDLSVQDSAGQTVLHLATQFEEVDAIEMVLKAKPKVDAADGKKMTALHVAAGKGNLEILRILVERGHANVNAVDAKGNTALHWACINNSSDLVDIIDFLVQKGAKPIKNATGNTALHSEAMHCDSSASWPTPAAQALIRAFPEIVTEVNKNNQTAQQTFDAGIDAEEAAPADAPAEASTSGKPGKEKRLNKAEAAAEFQEKAAAARAAAITRTKNKSNKRSDGNSSMSPLVWVAIVLALLAVLYSVLSPSAESAADAE